MLINLFRSDAGLQHSCKRLVWQDDVDMTVTLANKISAGALAAKRNLNSVGAAKNHARPEMVFHDIELNKPKVHTAGGASMGTFCIIELTDDKLSATPYWAFREELYSQEFASSWLSTQARLYTLKVHGKDKKPVVQASSLENAVRKEHRPCHRPR